MCLDCRCVVNLEDDNSLNYSLVISDAFSKVESERICVHVTVFLTRLRARDFTISIP
jgi:hypothetical protein